MTAYFTQTAPDIFTASEYTGGVWNTEELHISPLLGIMAHVAETTHGGDLQMGNFRCDILGTIPVGDISVTSEVIRPGRTIELVEVTATPVGHSRPAAVARVWFLSKQDTSQYEDVVGYGDIVPLADSAPLDLGEVWHGSFLHSIETRRARLQHGHNQAWMRLTHPLLEGQEVSPTARHLGLVDMANGVNTIGDPSILAYPNVEITVSLLRAPRSEWTGFSTRTGFSETGLGLNATTLFDEFGVTGTMSQTLTVRPR